MALPRAQRKTRVTPSGIAERVTPSGIAERVTPSGIAERVTPSGIAERVTPSGIAERVTPLGIKQRVDQRGLTLVELLIVIALIAVLGGTVLMGPGMLEGSRLKSAASLIVSGVRLGLARASTTGRPTRLSFDIDSGKLTLEEADSSVLLREHTKDASSGAAAATDLEKKAQAESERILQGPHAPRATFRAVPGFNPSPDEAGPGRSLGSGVQFISVQTEHDDEPRSSGRAYLYFFPGGSTERASVQLKRKGADGGLTVSISGLTGRAKVERGHVNLPPPRSDGEPSERDEP